jgi:hypothetical protein
MSLAIIYSHFSMFYYFTVFLSQINVTGSKYSVPVCSMRCVS